MRRSVRVLFLPPLILLLGLPIQVPSAHASCEGVPGDEWGRIVRADVVFLGRVVSQSDPVAPEKPNSSGPILKFVVERMWKGPQVDTLTVIDGHVRDREDRTGQTWLVLGHRSPYEELQMDPCDSHPLAESGDMLRVLQGLPATGVADIVDRALLEMFVAGLSDTSSRVRAESAWNLGFFDYADLDRIVPLLESAIRSDVPSVGESAIRALDHLGPPGDRALGVFSRAYENPPLRFAAIVALSRYRHRPDILHPIFLRAVRDTSSGVRRLALNYLVQDTDSASVLLPEIIRLLADPDSEVRWSAVIWIGMSRLSWPEVAPALLGVTEDPDPRVREAAVKALFEISPAESAPFVKRALADPSPVVRRTVMSLLAREDAPDRLRDFAVDRVRDDDDPGVRYWATELLFVGSSIGAKHRSAQIERAFADWRPEVWEALCQNVCEGRGVEGVSEHVRERLLTRVITMAERGVPSVRVAALRVLSCWRPAPQPVPLYDRALVSPYEEVRMEAIRGLSRIGAAAAPTLPRLRALAVGSSRQAEYIRKTIQSIEAAMIRP